MCPGAIRAIAPLSALRHWLAQTSSWPWTCVIPVSSPTSPQTPQKSIDLSTAPLREATWMVSTSQHPRRHQLVGDSEATLVALVAELASPGAPGPQRPEQPTLAAAPSGPFRASAPLDKVGIAMAAGRALPHERVVVAHGALAGHAREQLRLTQPSQYLGRSGGEGLGYALPAALGAALAYRGSDRVVVAFLTDGDTLYLPQALWTAARERIPLLAIIENNRSYWRDEIHQRAAAESRQRDPDVAAAGVRLDDPPVDLTAMARSFGVSASDPVHDVGGLIWAIETGLRVVEQGQPYVIEARRD